MNNFATIESSAGILKDDYKEGMTPLEAALRKKRRKLAETKGIELKEEETQDE